MTLLNMNIGEFNININVNRKEALKNKLEKHYNHKKRMKEAIELRNNLELKYDLNNILQ